MRYYSTRSKTHDVSFSEAALGGLAPDGGLYVPAEIPQLSPAVKSSLGSMSYLEIALELIRPWVAGDIPNGVLEEMIQDAYPFGAPLTGLSDRSVLELFHGPTGAFKDFGARFMARAFSYLRRGEDRPLKILVATSGDTGGAVADGFFGVQGVTVTVLYPQGRITSLQEKQIAGLGENISALAVEGSFDDCQRLVKEAFGDQELKERLALSSANSINISRLVPQCVYYASGAGEIPGAIISVPSGNFGNLTAGLYAARMGAPIAGFVAATNVNRTVPDYLATGNYEARSSVATLSNAMDVGAPSNFERMAAHFTLSEMRQMILGASVTDDETRETIGDVFSKEGYCLDPHTAVGWRAVDKLKAAGPLGRGDRIIVAATAHPAKFAETVEPITGPVTVPPSLQKALGRTVVSRPIPARLEALREYL
ncbi:MAG: threonine synthase [Treponema sp.]|nr:threonine synthase [Treponema sp.]